MSLKNDPNYIEGQWSAKSMLKHIDKTTYSDIDQAIAVKAEIIKGFENEFGFSRDMPNMDRNYAFTLGQYDYLVEHNESLKE